MENTKCVQNNVNKLYNVSSAADDKKHVVMYNVSMTFSPYVQCTFSIYSYVDIWSCFNNLSNIYTNISVDIRHKAKYYKMVFITFNKENYNFVQK